MTWVKLDTGFFRHPKAASVSRDARILYIAGLCYCGENLTDGVIPAAILRVLASEADVAKPAALAEELVTVGLWEIGERGYTVHDYLEWNKSAGRVHEEKEAAQTRMQRHRSREQPRYSNGDATPLQRQRNADVQQPDTDTDTDTEVTPNGVTERARVAAATPAAQPLKPIPKSRPQRLPNDWLPSEGDQAWAGRKGYPAALVEHETEKFMNHFMGTGATKADWSATWKNWLIRTAESTPPKVTPIHRNGRAPVDGNLSNDDLERIMRTGELP